MDAKVVGLDLAARPWRPTGAAVLTAGKIHTALLFGDDDILGFVGRQWPALVAVDAPLSLPAGRCCLRPEGGIACWP